MITGRLQRPPPKEPTMTVIKQEDFIQHCRCFPIYQLLLSVTTSKRSPKLGKKKKTPPLKTPWRKFGQQPHVCRRPPPHLPRHRHCHRVSQSGHECAVGEQVRVCRKWSTKACAVPTLTPTTPCAPLCWLIPSCAGTNTKRQQSPP